MRGRKRRETVISAVLVHAFLVRNGARDFSERAPIQSCPNTADSGHCGLTGKKPRHLIGPPVCFRGGEQQGGLKNAVPFPPPRRVPVNVLCHHCQFVTYGHVKNPCRTRLGKSRAAAQSARRQTLTTLFGSRDVRARPSSNTTAPPPTRQIRHAEGKKHNRS